MIRSSRIFKGYVKYCEVDVTECLKIGKTRERFYSTDNSIKSKTLNPQTLYRQLYSKIQACGPITVADYMKEILVHPTAGYYMSKDVFGSAGDFTTSPEISQLFGELVAVWIIHEWRKISKDVFQIVELGPGRGTLVKDMLRVFKQVQLTNKVSVHLVEISPTLSLLQAKSLCTKFEENDPKTNEKEENFISCYRKGITEDGVHVYWYYSINDVPKEFSVFVAHEFFDALPIHKFQKTNKGWSEVLVDINEGSTEEKFRYVLSNMPTPACEMYIANDETRDHVEISPQTMVIVDYISQFLYECGGFALIFDYGHSSEKTDTFRAFYQHKLHDPLSNPGAADLTADVDFSVIKRTAEKDNKLITFGPVNQSSFLKNLGIDVRLQMLRRTASKEEREHLESGYRMIMDEDKMGVRFKVLSMFPSVLKEYFKKMPVAGFDEVQECKT